MSRKMFLFVLVFLFFAFTATALGTTLTIQVATNKMSYEPGKTVTIRANAQLDLTRIVTSKIKSATVTVKDPTGKVLVNAAAMSKDPYTGLCFYNYTLPATAVKGDYTVSVTITDTSRNSGTATWSFKVKLPVPDHSKLITYYEGTKTCISCHSKQANDMFNSVHYQWNGDNSRSIELVGTTVSKLGGINDFCIWPDMNWLTIFNKVDGTKGPGGCAVCHAGLGKKPSPTVSQEQLENIDCLICHSPTYKRTVVQNADGTYSLAPDPSIDIQAAAKNIQRPGRAECMRCHEKSGGGDNYKRGDLESTLKACDYSYDVHMGTNGQNFTCQDCHKTENHRIAGRGSDMRALDSTFNLNCEVCHTQIPHRSYNTNYADLNRHTDKVNCTVCHIPTFAKSIPTDMHRNWQVMELDTAKQLYDPEIVKQTNVMPQYAWFNGYSHFYRFKDPVSLDERGVQKMSWPDGSFVDSGGKFSKLYAFKVHTASQPMEILSKVLLPVKNKTAFETGDVNRAIMEGAALANIPYTGHTFVNTERYMGISHGVGPKSTALSCSNQPCHGNENRIPFSKLGYTTRGTIAQLCDVCHSAKTYTNFTDLHAKHRGKKNCSACHGSGYPLKEPTTTLCDNCHKLRTYSDVNVLHAKHVASRQIDCINCHTFTASLTGEGHTKDN
ncbi:hypothetical protein ciss_04240 [Carboxydothermus islandicus]|uniref:Macroglobulin domain-containing protein n=1 Tax=Carboxydothermus islandicus TaxID=661089 RepID=A0A1L8D044_9THEO|nr:MG2 domain-containing protein [Carboxydothermus islandicus]GAV24491.1 hypothetical protein ciss_04240 [Carboxydothermus islandicus]